MKMESLLAIVIAAPVERHAAIVRAATYDSVKPKYVTRKDAAAFLGVHHRTIGRYARHGLIGERRISSRMLRYDLGELERFLAKGLNGCDGKGE